MFHLSCADLVSPVSPVSLVAKGFSWLWCFLVFLLGFLWVFVCGLVFWFVCLFSAFWFLFLVSLCFLVEIQQLIDQSCEFLALFLDLAKAFERINPNWILSILYLVQAPMWVINVFRRLLHGRYIQHKIQGYLMPPRLVYSGVDMGRSSSVFLFCLAMDPILVALNSIPTVRLVSGYIDDTSLVGEVTPSFDWRSHPVF